MITDHVKQLASLKAKATALESTIAAERASGLAALPAQYGFATVAAFVAAVRVASRGRPGRKAKAVSSTAKLKAAKARRKRAVITDATRAAVKKMVEEEKTGGEIAKALKISLPSVQNIKKALGLVKKPAKKLAARK